MIPEQKAEIIEKGLRERGFKVAYIFGSRVAGREHEDSDIDVGVLTEEPMELMEMIEVEKDIEKELEEDLDLVDLTDKDPRFAYNALRESKLIYSEDEELRVSFEQRLMRKYLDMKPFYDEYDRKVRERVTP
ncbi:MAG: nucleotidyltransferase domain-containing protein [Candidatus Aenigmatarchaeota archaeon]